MARVLLYIIILAILSVSAPLAMAQASGGGGPVGGSGGSAPFTCTGSSGVAPPNARWEGYAEIVGDIVVECNGGQSLPLGSVIPTADITVSFTTGVTSRLLPNAATSGVNASEALLLIDEPGSGLPGYGPTVPQTACPTPNVGAGAGGCTEFVGQTTINGVTTLGVPVASNPNTTTTGGTCSATNPCYTAASLSPGANVFQGVVNGSQVTFFGVPILPPVTAGFSRIYRITNIRANANAVSLSPSPGSIVGNVSTSGSASFPISDFSLTVAFVETGLNTAVALPSGTTLPSGGSPFNQTQSQTLAPAANLQFKENFATAFKQRVSSGVAPTGQSSTVLQNVPGEIFNSESGFTFSVGGGIAGLADYGARLKAVFTNVPSGVTIWATPVNIQPNNIGQPFNPGTGGVGQTGGVAPTSVSSFAQLIASETVSDDAFNPVAATTLPSGAAAGVVQLTTNANGTAVAIWEVTNSNPAAIDTFNFGVYISYNASPAPPSGTITVNLSYAPTPTQGAFAAASGPVANSLALIPRFEDDSTPLNAIVISPPPTITISAVPSATTSGTTFTNGTPTFTVNYADVNGPGLSTSSFSATLDGQNVTSSFTIGANQAIGAPATPSGSNTLTAAILDVNGLPGIGSLSFTVDNTPPAVTITPSNSSNQPTFVVAYSDSGSGVNTATFRATLDGTDVTSSFNVGAGAATFTPATPLAIGPHSLIANIQDNVGNQGSRTEQFTVSPTITLFTTLTAGIPQNITGAVPSGCPGPLSSTFTIAVSGDFPQGTASATSADGTNFSAVVNIPALSSASGGVYNVTIAGCNNATGTGLVRLFDDNFGGANTITPTVFDHFGRFGFPLVSGSGSATVYPAQPSIPQIHPDVIPKAAYDSAMGGLGGTFQTPQGRLGASTQAIEPANAPLVAAGNNLNTGSLSIADPLIVRGRKLSLNFKAFHNGQDAYAGPLGAGWTHSYNIFLIVSPIIGGVTLKEADGKEIPFSAMGGGAFTPGVPGELDALQQNADSTYTLTRRNHLQLHFTSAGQLTSITDLNGNAQTLTYTSGNLTSVTDNSGRSLQFTYDGSNRIVKVTDPLGLNVQYSYDAFDRLASYTDPAGGVWQYTYDNLNNLTQIADPLGNPEARMTYDAQQRVTSWEAADGGVTTYAYNMPSQGTTSKTDPLGRVTQYAFDGNGRIAQITNALAGISSVTYNANNMVTTSTDPLGHEWQFSYDANSNLVAATDPAGSQSTYTYDATNDLLTATDALAHTTTFNYDGNANLLKVQDAAGGINQFTYNANGQVMSWQNPTGATTQYAYDSQGNLTTVTNALGGMTQNAYDADGRVAQVTDPLSNSYEYALDGLGRLTQVTDPLGNIARNTYDANSNLTSVTDPLGNVTQYTYDVLNRVAAEKDAAGTAQQRTASYAYDADSELLSVTDPNGNVTRHAYDALGRRTSQIDPLGNTAITAYDGDGNIIALTDANRNTNRFAYDLDNRLVTETPFTGSAISHTYDAVGNEISMTDSRGLNTYAYDAVNRLISEHTPDGNTIAYGYDAGSRLTTLTLPSGALDRYTCDALNRVITAQDGAGNLTTYAYDADSRILKEAFPNGDSTNYTYDADGHVLSAVNMSGATLLGSNVYQYDAGGNRIKATTAAGGVTTYAYDHVNRVTAWTPSSGQVTSYAYDANGNRASVNAAGAVTNYAYDAANRMIASGAAAFTYDANGNLINDGAHAYTYDAYNRLTAVSGYNTSYSYDGHGRRIGQVAPAGTYAFVNSSLNGRALLENGPDGNFVNFYAGSHLISETSPALQIYYHYDSIGGVVSVTDNTGKVRQNYSYNAWGQNATIDTLGSKNKYKAMRGYTDPVTGFIYLGGRYYNPVWGRAFSGNMVAGYPDMYVFQGDDPVR